MVLQQAETEGYSVFAVTQTDPSKPLALPRTEADEIASTLPEPTSATRSGLHVSHRQSSAVSSSTLIRPPAIEGLEDEDYELQAALQASLMGAGGYEAYQAFAPPPHARSVSASLSFDLNDTASPSHSTSRSDSGAHTPTDEGQHAPPPLVPLTELEEELDPVEESLQRNRLMLQRMRAEQEFAQRDLWGEDASGADAAALGARRAERKREEEEEAEHLQRAIEESEALARIEGHAPRNDEEVNDIDMDVDQRPNSAWSDGHVAGHRVYDDDDAELQAALKASLEQVPEGWEFPELQQRTPQCPLSTANPPLSVSRVADENDGEDTESVLSAETEVHSLSDAATESVSVDELRRRRLAKFGA
ncbi:hypothetical protein DXG03_003077 [Asterophora parasitica]|uniref:Uncharacterized protein n=1 Tax=Asterophora parasitica TaxID=117018 RepID=A0A9P7KI74_9AGAR|nr:hypothetical protein DXG03_003077 [Asterophora parasitica]